MCKEVSEVMVSEWLIYDLQVVSVELVAGLR